MIKGWDDIRQLLSEQDGPWGNAAVVMSLRDVASAYNWGIPSVPRYLPLPDDRTPDELRDIAEDESDYETLFILDLASDRKIDDESSYLMLRILDRYFSAIAQSEIDEIKGWYC